MTTFNDGRGRGYLTPEQRAEFRAVADALDAKEAARNEWLARRGQAPSAAPQPPQQFIPTAAPAPTTPDTNDAQAMRDKAMNDWLAKRHGKESN